MTRAAAAARFAHNAARCNVYRLVGYLAEPATLVAAWANVGVPWPYREPGAERPVSAKFSGTFGVR